MAASLVEDEITELLILLLGFGSRLALRYWILGMWVLPQRLTAEQESHVFPLRLIVGLEFCGKFLMCMQVCKRYRNPQS